jgi:hypothetical protein
MDSTLAAHLHTAAWVSGREQGTGVNVTNQRERILHGSIVSEHIVQFFDDAGSGSGKIASFLHEGWKRGEALLVVMRPVHWAMTCPRLESAGCPVQSTIAEGRLVVLDAATMLATFMVSGSPDRARFVEHVGAAVHRLADSGQGLRIYGEMVDILAEQTNFRAAEELEDLWNELGQQYSFTLLCGYSSAHFTDPETGRRLAAICDTHMHAHADPADLLASWLLANHRSRCPTPS